MIICPLGRQFTVSLALPGSILDNAQSPELRTYLAGQVRRLKKFFLINVDHRPFLSVFCWLRSRRKCYSLLLPPSFTLQRVPVPWGCF